MHAREGRFGMACWLRRRVATVVLLICFGGWAHDAALAGGAPPAAASRATKTAHASAPAESSAPRETWDLLFLQRSRIGFTHSTISDAVEKGRAQIKVEQESRLAVKRFGEQTEQTMKFVCLETPDGELVRFESTVELGGAPTVSSGSVEGDQLVIATTTQGKTERRKLAWAPKTGGFFAVELGLRRAPMKPAERRTVRQLAPIFNDLIEVEMTAVDYEPTELLGGTYELLRIVSKVTLPGGLSMESVAWSDRTGDVLKTEIAAIGQTSLRATKELALEDAEEPAVDLGEGSIVSVSKPIPRPHETRRIRYEARIMEGDPAAAFVVGPTQELKPLAPNRAELTVRAIIPAAGTRQRDPSKGAEPSNDDRRPNGLIQSDDPKLVAMAAEAAANETDPWKVAIALERYVHDTISEKNFSQTFASAADVARSREGDCTEHAVLLAALARAKGIPARVAIGLVYMPSRQGFGYHMWNELFINNNWVGMDGTLARGGIGAAHLKLAHSNLNGASAYSSFLPVLSVLGRLRLDVLEIEYR